MDELSLKFLALEAAETLVEKPLKQKSGSQDSMENSVKSPGLQLEDLSTEWTQEMLMKDQPETFDAPEDLHLLKICTDLTEFDETKRQVEIERQFAALSENFRKSVQELHRDVLHRYNQIRLRIPAAFDADTERTALENNLKSQVEDMKARHAREMAQLEEEQAQTRSHFEDEIPILKKRALASLTHLKQELSQQHSDMNQKTSHSFKKLVADTFPAVSRYQIGSFLFQHGLTLYFRRKNSNGCSECL